MQILWKFVPSLGLVRLVEEELSAAVELSSALTQRAFLFTKPAGFRLRQDLTVSSWL